MGLFDNIKDALTVDDGERLAAAQKQLTRLEADLQHAKDRNDIAQIATIESQIDAAKGQISDLQAKLGQTPAASAEAPVETATPVEEARIDTPAAPVESAPVDAAPAPAAPAPAAPAAPVESVPAPAPEPVHAASDRTYTVKPGDTLSAIGRQFGVSYQAIAEANNIENPDLIYPGQVFKIPNA